MVDTRGETAGVWTRRRWISLAAGVSVAYVFVDVLPELGARHLAFVKAPSRVIQRGLSVTIAMGAGGGGDVSHAPGLQWALVMQIHD